MPRSAPKNTTASTSSCPRARSATASPGKRWPPVPPPANAILKAEPARPREFVMGVKAGLARPRSPLAQLAGQGHQHADGRERHHHRRAAVADERKDEA